MVTSCMIQKVFKFLKELNYLLLKINLGKRLQKHILVAQSSKNIQKDKNKQENATSSRHRQIKKTRSKTLKKRL